MAYRTNPYLKGRYQGQHMFEEYDADHGYLHQHTQVASPPSASPEQHQYPSPNHPHRQSLTDEMIERAELLLQRKFLVDLQPGHHAAHPPVELDVVSPSRKDTDDIRPMVARDLQRSSWYDSVVGDHTSDSSTTRFVEHHQFDGFDSYDEHHRQPADYRHVPTTKDSPVKVPLLDSDEDEGYGDTAYGFARFGNTNLIMHVDLGLTADDISPTKKRQLEPEVRPVSVSSSSSTGVGELPAATPREQQPQDPVQPLATPPSVSQNRQRDTHGASGTPPPHQMHTLPAADSYDQPSRPSSSRSDVDKMIEETRAAMAEARSLLAEPLPVSKSPSTILPDRQREMPSATLENSDRPNAAPQPSQRLSGASAVEVKTPSADLVESPRPQLAASAGQNRPAQPTASQQEGSPASSAAQEAVRPSSSVTHKPKADVLVVSATARATSAGPRVIVIPQATVTSKGRAVNKTPLGRAIASSSCRRRHLQRAQIRLPILYDGEDAQRPVSSTSGMEAVVRGSSLDPNSDREAWSTNVSSDSEDGSSGEAVSDLTSGDEVVNTKPKERRRKADIPKPEPKVEVNPVPPASAPGKQNGDYFKQRLHQDKSSDGVQPATHGFEPISVSDFQQHQKNVEAAADFLNRMQLAGAASSIATAPQSQAPPIAPAVTAPLEEYDQYGMQREAPPDASHLVQQDAHRFSYNFAVERPKTRHGVPAGKEEGNSTSPQQDRSASDAAGSANPRSGSPTLPPRSPREMSPPREQFPAEARDHSKPAEPKEEEKPAWDHRTKVQRSSRPRLDDEDPSTAPVRRKHSRSPNASSGGRRSTSSSEGKRTPHYLLPTAAWESKGVAVRHGHNDPNEEDHFRTPPPPPPVATVSPARHHSPHDPHTCHSYHGGTMELPTYKQDVSTFNQHAQMLLRRQQRNNTNTRSPPRQRYKPRVVSVDQLARTPLH